MCYLVIHILLSMNTSSLLLGETSNSYRRRFYNDEMYCNVRVASRIPTKVRETSSERERLTTF